MTQPIAITATTIPLADRHSPAELSACSVSSIDWSASSASASSDPDQSDHDGNPDHLGSPHRTPGKSSHRASLALTDLSSTTAALSVVSSSEDDQSPCTSPSRARARARVLSGSTAPTSLLSDDKPEVLDSSDEDDELSRGGRGMAASVPNTPAFRRAGTGGKKGENRPRAQTDVARRGSRQLNLGMLEGAAADELASWINASPSPFEPSTPLTATALSAVGSVVNCLPSSSPGGDNITPRKTSYGFIPGPGVART